jgi:hypothetical protein
MRNYQSMAMASAGILCSLGVYFYFWGTDNTPPQEEDTEPPYENLYPLGLSVEEVRNNETKENIDQDIVEEVTPKGKLILRYCDTDNCFLYWSNKPQDYKYLEVSARKYVILFDCKDKYINMFRELVKSIKKHDAAEQEKDNPSKKKSSVFATYKTYEVSGPPKLANEKANIYKWIGKLKDFNVVLDNEVSRDEGKRNLSYLEYKRKY